MGKKEVRIDHYISNSSDFAIPILTHFRDVVHEACPEVTETLKWSMPYFEYRQYNLCSMASFRQHCAFGFWLASKMKDPHHLLITGDEKTAMGSLGKVTKIEDLPSEELLKCLVQEAMELIENDMKGTWENVKRGVGEVSVPGYFQKILADHPQAGERFEEFNLSSKREYVEWISEAKTEVTRNKRIQKAIKWISEGKSRYWKYQK
jgi:uncharacterized protein YdeI (YjbR/CyaY-like superfamily)